MVEEEEDYISDSSSSGSISILGADNQEEAERKQAIHSGSNNVRIGKRKGMDEREDEEEEEKDEEEEEEEEEEEANSMGRDSENHTNSYSPIRLFHERGSNRNGNDAGPSRLSPSPNPIESHSMGPMFHHQHTVPSNGGARPLHQIKPLEPLHSHSTLFTNSDPNSSSNSNSNSNFTSINTSSLYNELDFRINLKQLAPPLVEMLTRLAPGLGYTAAVQEVKSLVNYFPIEARRTKKIPEVPVVAPPRKTSSLTSEQRERAQKDAHLVSEGILALASLSPSDPKIMARFILASLEEFDPSKSLPQTTRRLQKLSSTSTDASAANATGSDPNLPPASRPEPSKVIPNIKRLNEIVGLIHETESDPSKSDVEIIGLTAVLAQEYHRQAALCETKDGNDEFKVWKGSVSEEAGGSRKQVFRLELAQRVDLMLWAFGSPLAVALIPHFRGFHSHHSLRTCDRDLFSRMIHFLLDATWIDGIGPEDENLGQMAEIALRGLISKALRIAERTIKRYGFNFDPRSLGHSHFIYKTRLFEKKKPYPHGFLNPSIREESEADEREEEEGEEEEEFGLIFQGHPVKRVLNEFAEKPVVSNKGVRRAAALGIPSLPDHDVRPRCDRGEVASSSRAIKLRPFSSGGCGDWDSLSTETKRMEIRSNHSEGLDNYSELFQLQAEGFLSNLIQEDTQTIFDDSDDEDGKEKGKGKEKARESENDKKKLSRDFFIAHHKSTSRAIRLNLFKKAYGAVRKRNHVQVDTGNRRKRVKTNHPSLEESGS